jgi:hypothetical protein
VIAGDCGNSRPSASSTGGRVLGLERLAQAGVRGPVSLYGIPRSAGALFKHRKAGTGDGMKKPLRTGASGRARSRNNRPGSGSLTSGRRLAAARRPARPA